MIKRIRNFLFPEKKVNQLYACWESIKKENTSYSYNNVQYSISSKQVLYSFIYQSSIITGVVAGISGKFFVSVLVRVLVAAFIGVLSARIALFMFIVEAEKNVLSDD